MLSASHVAESLRDSEEPQLGCGVSLGEADLRDGVQRKVSSLLCFAPPLYYSIQRLGSQKTGLSTRIGLRNVR